MCFCRTVGHLVCYYTYLVWPKFKLGEEKLKIHLGEKGCGVWAIWKVLQLKVILTRNLNLMKKFDECSFCSFRSFDNELWSKQWSSSLRSQHDENGDRFACIFRLWFNLVPLSCFVNFSRSDVDIPVTFQKKHKMSRGAKVKWQNVTPFLQLFRQQTSVEVSLLSGLLLPLRATWVCFSFY